MAKLKIWLTSSNRVAAAVVRHAGGEPSRRRPMADGRGDLMSIRLLGAVMGPGAKYPTARMGVSYLASGSVRSPTAVQPVEALLAGKLCNCARR